MRLHLKLFMLTICIFMACSEKKKNTNTSKNNSKGCIEAILKKDDSLGKLRNHACKTISLDKTITQYVEAIDNLNFEGCPEDFKNGFQSHIKAWSKMSEFTESYSDLRGEMHVLFNTIEKEKDSAAFKPLLKAIWDTWAEIETAKVNAENKTEVAFTIPEANLIPEGIAYDKTTETFFLSSTYKRKIVAIDKYGKNRDFTPPESTELLGVVGMRVDNNNRTLWALSSHAGDGMPMENMKAEEQGMSRIHKFNIDTGEVIKTYQLDTSDGRNFLNDLTLAKNGDIFITDTVKKRIYRIDYDTEELNLFYQLENSMSPNGIDITEDQRYLFVAVYGGSNVIRIDLDTKELKIISMPKNEKMIADGLYCYQNNLVTVQPRNEGKIVSKYYLNHDRNVIESYIVLESNNPNLSQPTTGVIVEDDFYFIANSQLQLFKRIYNKEDDSTELKNPVVLKIKLN